MSEDEIQYPSGFGLKDVVFSKTIIKTPLDSFDEERVRLILRERQIYERFAKCGGRKGILSYHGIFESGSAWKAIDFIHGAGVIHGDLTCENIFLDENLNAKLANFAGSSMDGSPLSIVAPYNGLSDEEISTRYSKGEFPNTEFLQAIGGIIRRCWQGRYSGCDSAIRDIRGTFPSNSLFPIPTPT
ncbi:hypothetical protein DL95DRAFT_430257 [Leptodontidium sp. 2 PMI_412]|nr:hypothetical protein DL95DRAFT_430257 [Leptodontidium sp. 2 PMI_412]